MVLKLPLYFPKDFFLVGVSGIRPFKIFKEISLRALINDPSALASIFLAAFGSALARINRVFRCLLKLAISCLD